MQMNLKRFVPAIPLLLVSGLALAQNPDGLSLTEVGQVADFQVNATSPGTAEFDVNYLGQNSISDFRVVITYDETVLTPQTTGTAVDGCLDNLQAAAPAWFFSGNSGCDLVGNEIRLSLVETSAAGATLPTLEPLGTITFDVAPGAAIGPSLVEFTVLEVFDDNNASVPTTTLDTQNGTVQIAGPSLTFNPLGDGSTTLTGDVAVGSSGALTSITVTESGTDNVTLDGCQITGADAGDFALTYSGTNADASPDGLPATFTGDSDTSGTLAIACTPDRGTSAGTLTCEVQDPGNSNAVLREVTWPLDCSGRAPLVSVSGPANLEVANVATAPANTDGGDITISEAGDAFSLATSVSVSAAGPVSGTGTPPTISATAITDEALSVGGELLVTATCEADSNTDTGNFTRDFTVEWTPDETGGTTSETVTVTCVVNEAFPVYESDPDADETLAFGPITNGTTSGPLGIDVGNSGAVGGADLNVTGATITGGDAGQFDLTFSAFTIPAGESPDSTNDITVTCSPDAIGSYTDATLVVNTNDPAEPSGGFEYPLTCEGTSDAVFDSTPAPGGTLNLGIVPPGQTTPEGLIEFFNEGSFDSLDVDCTVTDAEGVFTFTPDPIDFTIAAGESESVGFQCTPPTPNTFTAAVSCDVTGTPGPIQADYTVLCPAEPLIIPTLSRWGLLLMALFVLGIGGLAGRRMMA